MDLIIEWKHVNSENT